MRLQPPWSPGMALALGMAATLCAPMSRAEAPVPSPAFFGEPVLMEARRMGREEALRGNPLATRKAAGNCRVELGNGSVITGELLSLNEREIIWKSPSIPEKLRLPISEVRGIFSQREFEAEQPPAMAGDIPGLEPIPGSIPGFQGKVIKLAGNDWLCGEIASKDGNRFQLQIPGMEKPIALSRDDIRWISFSMAMGYFPEFAGVELGAEGLLARMHSARVEEGMLTLPKGEGHFELPLPGPWDGAEVLLLLDIARESEPGLRVTLVDKEPRQSLTFSLDPHRLRVHCQERFWDFQCEEGGGQNGDKISHYRIMAGGFWRRSDSRTTIVVFRNGREIAHFNPKEGTVPTDLFELVRKNVFDEDGLALGAAISGLGESLGFRAGNAFLGTLCSARVEAINSVVVEPVADESCVHRRITAVAIDGSSEDGRASSEFVKISQFLVAPWDSAFASGSGKGPAADAHLLVNEGMGISGTLRGLTPQALVFSTGKVSARQAMLMRFESKAPQRANVARLSLFSVGEFCISSLEKRSGSYHCRASFSEDVEIPPEALKSIRFTPREAVPPGQGPALVFCNGDELKGAPLTAEKKFGWKLESGQEIHPALGQVAGIRFHPTSRKQSASALIKLRNGDRLAGQLVSMDERGFVWKEATLGPLALPREHMWKLFASGSVAHDGESWSVDVSSEVDLDPELWEWGSYAATPFDGCYLMRGAGGFAQTVSLPKGRPFEARMDIVITVGNEWGSFDDRVESEGRSVDGSYRGGILRQSRRQSDESGYVAPLRSLRKGMPKQSLGTRDDGYPILYQVLRAPTSCCSLSGSPHFAAVTQGVAAGLLCLSPSGKGRRCDGIRRPFQVSSPARNGICRTSSVATTGIGSGRVGDAQNAGNFWHKTN